MFFFLLNSENKLINWYYKTDQNQNIKVKKILLDFTDNIVELYRAYQHNVNCTGCTNIMLIVQGVPTYC